MATSKSAVKIITVISRLVTLVFAVLAIIAFVETRNILNHSIGPESFTWECEYDDDTYEPEECVLKVPLILCVPEHLEVDGHYVYSDASQGVAQCQRLDFLINSCAAGLLFAAIASLLFLIIDFMARRKKGPFNLSTAAGMGLFLFFILIQTGISTMALVQQNSIWVDYYQLLFDQIKSNENDEDDYYYFQNIDIKVEAYGNIAILTSSCMLAFIASALTVIDAVCFRCGQGGSNDSNSDPMQDENKGDERAKKGLKDESKKKEKSKSGFFSFGKKNPPATATTNNASKIEEPKIEAVEVFSGGADDGAGSNAPTNSSNTTPSWLSM